METYYVYTEIVKDGIHYTIYLEADDTIRNALLSISKTLNPMSLYNDKSDVFYCSGKTYTQKQVDSVLIGTIDRFFPGDVMCLPLGYYNSKFLVNIGNTIYAATDKHQLYREVTNMEWILPTVYVNTPESCKCMRILCNN